MEEKTNLHGFLQEEKDFAEKKIKFLKQYTDEKLEEIAKKVKDNRNMRIAFTVAGTYEYMEKYGFLRHQMGTVSFHTTFVGVIKGKAVLQNVNSFALDSCKIPLKTLYVCDAPLKVAFTSIASQEQEIILNHIDVNGPNWTIEDLIYHQLPSDLRGNLFTVNKNIHTMKLYIGNQEFKEFMNKRNSDEIAAIKKLLIW